MNSVVIIPDRLDATLREHLFQNPVEQGAFLFAEVRETTGQLILEVADMYLVPPDGWSVQLEDYLEMKDTERAKIMKKARDGGFGVIDCHSHPRATDDVCFSLSDRRGIEEFAAYARWKLDGKPYVATAWGASSVDAVLWHGEFTQPNPLGEIRVTGDRTQVVKPQRSWFRPARSVQRRPRHGR